MCWQILWGEAGKRIGKARKKKERVVLQCEIGNIRAKTA